MHEDPQGSARKAFGVVFFAVILVMALVVVLSVPWLHNHFGLTLPEGSPRRRLLGLRYLRDKKIEVERSSPSGGKEQVDLLPLWPTRYPVLAGICCAMVNAVAVIYCLWPGRDWKVRGQLPGILVQSTSLLVAQGFGILLLLAGALLLPGRTGTSSGRTKRRSIALYGLAGAAVAVIACFVGWLYTDAVAQWTSSWLAPKGEKGPKVPEPVQLMGMMLVPVLITAAAAWGVISAVVRLLPVPPCDRDRDRKTGRTRAARSRPGVSEDEISEPALSKDEQRHLQKVEAARRRHHYLLKALDWLLAFTALLIVFFVAAYYCHLGIRPSQEGARNLVYDALGTASVPMLAALAGLMLLAFRTLALRPEMRQNAGLAWAFGAFWPRAVHPFAPPPWTVRAVPEFVWRLKALLEEKGKDRRVLIRANSMGSVLVLAAVWQLKGPARRRIALLTTGSPVRTYFTRHYPGFVCADSIACLAPCGEGTLAGWTNVWRDTDPLGGPVRLDCVDERWPDDGEDGAGAEDGKCERTKTKPVFPPIEGHRGYTTDARLLTLRRELVQRLLGEGRPSRRTPDPSSGGCSGRCRADGVPERAAGDPATRPPAGKAAS
ncbi:hypothetical protein [Streptomyces sp. NPDC047043]|uniref:hypothetical protein n=1 Tax=Streptomyces sp. NPDC047043 TaxID=3154497 RepID=UPI0033D06149